MPQEAIATTIHIHLALASFAAVMGAGALRMHDGWVCGPGLDADARGPLATAMTASDKLFHWLFQSQPDCILQLLPDLEAAAAPDGGGYRLLAPVLIAREYRPDGAVVVHRPITLEEFSQSVAYKEIFG
ncbi:MAG: hypothetical protein ACK5QW_06695 [Cyanobacteriota bacterium]